MLQKTRRLGALLAMPLGIAVVVAVLLIQPWGGGDKATGALIEYRFCNTIVKAPTSDKLGELQVTPVTGERYGDPTRRPTLSIGVERPDRTSFVELDAVTGASISTSVNPADNVLIDGVLSSKRIESNAPAFWPYSAAVQVPPACFEGTFRYRDPDPGSGLIVLGQSGLPPMLIVKNCRSAMTVTGKEAGGVQADYSGVAPEDRAAFQTFVSEVTYEGYQP